MIKIMKGTHFMNYIGLPNDITSVPHVIKQTPNGREVYDIFSRLLEDRIIMICDQINAETAQLTIAQMLYLEARDPDKDITLYINSPGGSVSDGLAIFDTMKLVKPDVSTVCIGLAASMGSFLLAGGAKGKRFILPNAEVMIHQPLGGMQGQASDMAIAMKHMEHTKQKLTKYYSEMTGKDYDTLTKDMDRDNWMSAEEAVEYGLADKIVEHH